MEKQTKKNVKTCISISILLFTDKEGGVVKWDLYVKVPGSIPKGDCCTTVLP